MVLGVGKIWNDIRLLKLLRREEVQKTDWILIQYVPHLYNERAGINFIFPLFIFLLKIIYGKKIALYVHELKFPFQFTLKTLIMNVCHKLQMFVLYNSADTIGVTTNRLQNELKEFGDKRICQINVGSNIKKVVFNSLDLENLYQSFDISQERPGVLLFGGFHPTKLFDQTYPILSRMTHQYQLQVIHIGITKQDVPQELQQFVTPSFKFTGPLEEEAISLLFQSGRPLISLFMDGATTRRGTLITGIDHSTPTFTNKTEFTESVLFECENLIFIEPESLEEALTSFFQNPKNTVNACKAFSWTMIAKEIEQSLLS